MWLNIVSLFRTWLVLLNLDWFAITVFKLTVLYFMFSFSLCRSRTERAKFEPRSDHTILISTVQIIISYHLPYIVYYAGFARATKHRQRQKWLLPFVVRSWRKNRSLWWKVKELLTTLDISLKVAHFCFFYQDALLVPVVALSSALLAFVAGYFHRESRRRSLNIVSTIFGKWTVVLWVMWVPTVLLLKYYWLCTTRKGMDTSKRS